MRTKTMTEETAGKGAVQTIRPPHHQTTGRAAGGSAYLIALLVMLVLTLMGIALSVLTQTELLIGSNERQIQRLFFAADAGRAASTAKALTANDYDAYEFELDEASVWDNRTAVTTRHVLQMSPFYPAQSEICDLCDAANEMSLKEDPLHRTAFAVTSTAIRQNELDDNELGRKVIGTFVDIHPLDPTVDAIRTLIQDDTGLADTALAELVSKPAWGY